MLELLGTFTYSSFHILLSFYYYYSLTLTSSLPPSTPYIFFLSLTCLSFLPLARSLVYLTSFLFLPLSLTCPPPMSLTCLPSPQQVFPRVSGIGQELERTYPKLYGSVARQLSISITSDKVSYIIFGHPVFFLSMLNCLTPPCSFPSRHLT